MVLKKTENAIHVMLTDTILALCRNTLPYRGQLAIDGLLGITLDDEEIFLVSIKETATRDIKRKAGQDYLSEDSDDTVSSDDGRKEIHKKKKRSKHKRKQERVIVGKSNIKEKAGLEPGQVGHGHIDLVPDIFSSQDSEKSEINTPSGREGRNHLKLDSNLLFVKQEPFDDSEFFTERKDHQTCQISHNTSSTMDFDTSSLHNETESYAGDLPSTSALQHLGFQIPTDFSTEDQAISMVNITL